ncbi:Rv3235 family protein [Nocardioides insulae]|uniref:Rv3235 family protein n=1 Tax=Nocardioides insulae TaxID=394734 RepID=UPI0006870683|nr:Rv3235 family protein [Nocardioides insulae]
MPDREVVPFRAEPPSSQGSPASRPGDVDTSVQGTLALDLQPRQDPPQVRSPRRPTAAHGPARGSAQVVPIRRSSRVPDVRNWAWRFGQAAVEIVGGDRPLTQLLRWTSSDVYEDLAERARTVGRAGRHSPGQGRVQPVRPRVVNAHVAQPRPGVAEAALHVRYGERSRALAARFEERAGRWVCTALEFA